MQCLKALYLYKYHGKLRDPITEARLSRFEEGHAIGIKAQQLFPGGILLRNNGPSRPAADQRETQRMIETGQGILYESAFIFNGVLVYNDILVKHTYGWHLYEVKSNQLVKDHYIEDLALQTYVVSSAGLPLHRSSLIHLRIPLDEIKEDMNVTDIFTITDLTEECNNRQKTIEENIRKMQLTLSLRRVPDIAVGAHCDEPYACEFKGHCTQHPTEERSGLFSNIS